MDGPKVSICLFFKIWAQSRKRISCLISFFLKYVVEPANKRVLGRRRQPGNRCGSDDGEEKQGPGLTHPERGGREHSPHGRTWLSTGEKGQQQQCQSPFRRLVRNVPMCTISSLIYDKLLCVIDMSFDM
ncbi:hypothetical protein SLE2022_231890 [Rubroshorea leprosula]